MYYKNLDLDTNQIRILQELEENIASINQDGSNLDTNKLSRLFEKASTLVPPDVLTKTAQSLLLQASEMNKPSEELFALALEYNQDTSNANAFMCHILCHLLRNERYEESKQIAAQILSFDVESGSRVLQYLAVMSDRYPETTAHIFSSIFSSLDSRSYYYSSEELYKLWNNESPQLRVVMDAFFPGVHAQTKEVQSLLDVDPERVKEQVLEKLYDRLGSQHHASMTLQ